MYDWGVMKDGDIFRYMQMAVEAAQTSEHETSQVGACLVSGDDAIAHPNFWPKLVKDCLLYTSPSPRDQRGSRMPSSA